MSDTTTTVDLKKYLNLEGLVHFFNKIKDEVFYTAEEMDAILPTIEDVSLHIHNSGVALTESTTTIFGYNLLNTATADKVQANDLVLDVLSHNLYKITAATTPGTTQVPVEYIMNFTGPKGEQGIQGVSGVYVGPGEMPDGYDVQIDPDGTSATISLFTPQMFGAKADGVTDDSDAINDAFNQGGGIVYFPAGIYRADKQLNALKPCTIIMEGRYPSSYDSKTKVTNEDGSVTYIDVEERDGDYPSAHEGTERYGARIETYATDGIGLLLGDSVSVDGLAIRAMDGFSGVVLKYDGSQGPRSYPGQAKLEHIRVDCATATVRPESMFDFNPYKTYGVYVNDILIGTNHIRTVSEYGWRTSLKEYANSIRLDNVKIDMHAKYPFYINTKEIVENEDGTSETKYHQAYNWTIRNLTVQAYGQYTSGDVTQAAHENLITLIGAGLAQTYFSGCNLWDVTNAQNNNGISGPVIYKDGIGAIAAFGNDTFFDALDTIQTDKITQIASEKSLSVRQVETAVDNYLADKAEGYYKPANNNQLNPTERAFANRFTPNDFDNDGCTNTAYLSDGSGYFEEGAFVKSYGYWTTSLIPCGFGDVVRLYYCGDQNKGNAIDQMSTAIRKPTVVCEYDKTGAVCTRFVDSTALTSNEYTVLDRDTAFVRFTLPNTSNYSIPYNERTYHVMATVNYAVNTNALNDILIADDGSTYSQLKNVPTEEPTAYTAEEWKNMTGIELYGEVWDDGISEYVSLTDTETGIKYKLQITNGTLQIVERE